MSDSSLALTTFLALLTNILNGIDDESSIVMTGKARLLCVRSSLLRVFCQTQVSDTAVCR